MVLAGAMGDDVTTTGGPEQSFADPDSDTTTAGDPVVIDRDADWLEGDDIVVEPDLPLAHPRRRARELAVGVVVVVLVGAGIAVAVATRDSGGSSKVQSIAPAQPPAAHPAPANHAAIKPVAPKPNPSKITPKSVHVTPPVGNAIPPVASTPVAVSPPPTAPTTPPVESPSVLQWQSTPSALSMKAGTAKSFTVSVTNPTAGTVNLPHPLSCPPALLRANGAAIGFAVCTEMVQVMDPHQTLARHYTIYATNTADASGQPLAAGSYIARVENLFNVNVTVTAN